MRKYTKIKVFMYLLSGGGAEEKNIAKYIWKKKKIDYFNYDWFEPDKIDIKMEYDEEYKGYYVWKDNQRMYMKKSWNAERAKSYCQFLFMEQHINSPHRYLDEDIEDINGVIVDAGGAEGSFALNYNKKCKKIYILECDEEWIEALEYTFKGNENVIIVKKFLTDYDDKDNVTLDSLIAEEQVDLIKLDIEGEELKALKGASRLIERSKRLKLLICAYHYQDEERDIRSFFDEKWKVLARKGYMIFVHEKEQKPPYLRRGVLKVYK